jgi:hypothetical protein
VTALQFLTSTKRLPSRQRSGTYIDVTPSPTSKLEQAVLKTFPSFFCRLVLSAAVGAAIVILE